VATGTVIPWLTEQFEDSSGTPLNGGFVFTYLAGTTTPVATYTDVGLTTPHANPIVLNSAGRPSSGGSDVPIYLTPGVSYKFLIQNSASVTIVTRDNISAIPPSAQGLDVVGTVGENITANQAVYLSDGSGGKTQGQWYRADSTSPYSSTANEVGVALAAITSGTSGTIRLAGTTPGFSALSTGALYYVSATPGTLSSTPSATNYRLVGQADSATSMVLFGGSPVAAADAGICEGRLTLLSGQPAPASDASAATTIFYTPYKGNRISLYDGAKWNIRASAEVSIAVPATTSQMYDIFAFDSTGTVTLELLAWTNDTTRATSLTRQDGVICKTGDATRRYIGSFRTTTVSGQTEDSATKRYLWNFSNRIERTLRRVETAANWTYNTATWRQANANVANQVEVVIGIQEVRLDLSVQGTINNGTGGAVAAGTAIGEDATATYLADQNGGVLGNIGNTVTASLISRLVKYPAVGRHFYAWIEIGGGVTTTFYGVGAFIAGDRMSGITGHIEA